MNEAKFRAELYERLKNSFENEEVEVKIQDRGPLQEKEGTSRKADLVIYFEDKPFLIIETKSKDKNLKEGTTQAFQYGFAFAVPTYKSNYISHVAVCSPTLLKIYEYDPELGKKAWDILETPRDKILERRFFEKYNLEERILKKFSFEEDSISRIASKLIRFLKLILKRAQKEGYFKEN